MMYTPESEPMAQKIPSTTVFLAGAIDNGSAIDWQKIAADKFWDKGVSTANPRRMNFSSLDTKMFNEQVNWELTALDQVDNVLMYLPANSIAPISLLELGLLANSDKNIVVVCEEGYHRKGNVDIVCERYNIKTAQNLDAGISLMLKTMSRVSYAYDSFADVLYVTLVGLQDFILDKSSFRGEHDHMVYMQEHPDERSLLVRLKHGCLVGFTINGLMTTSYDSKRLLELLQCYDPNLTLENIDFKKERIK